MKQLNNFKFPKFNKKREVEEHLKNCWIRLCGNSGSIIRRFIAVNTERVEIDRTNHKIRFITQHDVVIDSIHTIYLDKNGEIDKDYWLQGNTNVPIITV